MSYEGLLTMIFGFLAGIWLLLLALLIFSLVVNWKMFKKAGKPGWASIVPVYNTIVLLDIIGYKWYYIFFAFLGVIPIVGFVLSLIFMISLNIKLAKSFGQSEAFGIGLWLLNPIFIAIIAFSKDIKYVGASVNGDIDFNDLF
jgi:hypothetical protein